MATKKKDPSKERLEKLESFFQEVQYLLRRYNEDKDGFYAGDVQDAIRECGLEDA